MRTRKENELLAGTLANLLRGLLHQVAAKLELPALEVAHFEFALTWLDRRTLWNLYGIERGLRDAAVPNSTEFHLHAFLARVVMIPAATLRDRSDASLGSMTREAVQHAARLVSKDDAEQEELERLWLAAAPSNLDYQEEDLYVPSDVER